MYEKADVFISDCKGTDDEVVMEIANKCKTDKGSLARLGLGIYSVKTDCLQYEWVYYVEVFFGKKKVTRIFKRVS